MDTALPRRTLSTTATFKENFDAAQDLISRTWTEADLALDSLAEFLDRDKEVEVLAKVLEEGKEFSDETPGDGKEEITAASPSAGPASAPLARAASSGAVHRIGERMLRGDVHMLDKVSFTLGVANIALVAFWLGASPSTYQYCWLIKCLTLFTMRWFSYRSRGLHYMMLEFCYAGNILAALQIFWVPSSPLLRRLAFAHMAGPLMWSIVAMRNSLVFHDVDKQTTLMMHASPAILAWTMRWRPRPEWTAGLSPDQLADFGSSSWTQMALLPMVFYLAWALAYYVLIFVLLEKRIRSRGYSNMFEEMVSGPALKGKKSPLSSFVLRAPPRLQPVLYLSIHMTAAWVSLLPTKLLWDHPWLHTMVLLAILLVATWNGANFYFKVFAKRYLADAEAARAKRHRE
uniref:Glycerophosphocholine acyltransferase 1 n=1 Tax=Auxenochlorella protothecoides TaxID=3075 RepID=A0A1D2A5Y9_AUXPR